MVLKLTNLFIAKSCLFAAKKHKGVGQRLSLGILVIIMATFLCFPARPYFFFISVKSSGLFCPHLSVHTHDTTIWEAQDMWLVAEEQDVAM